MGEYKEGLSSTLFKFSVYLAYSDEYLALIEECEQTIKDCSSSDGAIMLSRLLEFIGWFSLINSVLFFKLYSTIGLGSPIEP